MDASNKTEAVGANGTTVERRSDREVVVTRWFDAPARIVFEAWSTPELFRKWWVPKSMGMTLHDCEMDVRTGGTYRLNFGEGMDFFGRYIDVMPPERIVWKRSMQRAGQRKRCRRRSLSWTSCSPRCTDIGIAGGGSPRGTRYSVPVGLG